MYDLAEVYACGQLLFSSKLVTDRFAEQSAQLFYAGIPAGKFLFVSIQNLAIP